jgi:hypothetical protein
MPEELNKRIPNSKFGDFLRKVFDVIMRIMEKIFDIIDNAKLKKNMKKMMDLYHNEDYIPSPITDDELYDICHFVTGGADSIETCLSGILAKLNNPRSTDSDTSLKRFINNTNTAINTMAEIQENIRFGKSKIYLPGIKAGDFFHVVQTEYMHGAQNIKANLRSIKKTITKNREAWLYDENVTVYTETLDETLAVLKQVSGFMDAMNNGFVHWTAFAIRYRQEKPDREHTDEY